MATSAEPLRWTAKLLLERLRRHYIKPGDSLAGGVFLPEVTMGRQGGGRCDAVYAGFTRTRGERLIGHEIKVTRADWLHELDQPDKAEVWASQCHEWYIVAPSTDVVRVEELPHGWGLLIPNARTKTRMDVIVKAAVHEDRNPDWTTSLSVIKKMDTERAEAIREARQKAADELRNEQRKLREHGFDEHQIRSDRRRITGLENLLAEVATALGVTSIVPGDSSWRGGIPAGNLTESLGRFLHADSDADRALRNRQQQFVYARDIVRRMAADIDTAEQAVASALSERTR